MRRPSCRVIALSAFSALVACSHRPASPAPSPTTGFDLVIANGRIVDGTGNAWFYGDIGVANGRIARIAPRGALSAAPAGRRIDARGLVVAPGVIDIQAQS